MQPLGYYGYFLPIKRGGKRKAGEGIGVSSARGKGGGGFFIKATKEPDHCSSPLPLHIKKKNFFVVGRSTKKKKGVSGSGEAVGNSSSFPSTTGASVPSMPRGGRGKGGLLFKAAETPLLCFLFSPFEANVNSMPMQKPRSCRCLYSKKRLTPQEFLIFKVQGKGEYRNDRSVLHSCAMP